MTDLWFSSVLRRVLQPVVGPAPAGEHREEGGPDDPADHEPAAHPASVLRGRELSEGQVTRRGARHLTEGKDSDSSRERLA